MRSVEGSFAKMKADMEAKQAEHPTICYWENCEENRIKDSVYCGPHAVRVAIINQTLFRRPGRGKTQSN